MASKNAPRSLQYWPAVDVVQELGPRSTSLWNLEWAFWPSMRTSERLEETNRMFQRFFCIISMALLYSWRRKTHFTLINERDELNSDSSSFISLLWIWSGDFSCPSCVICALRETWWSANSLGIRPRKMPLRAPHSYNLAQVMIILRWLLIENREGRRSKC